MHEGQLSLSVETVRELVDQQFPQWRDRAVRAFVSQGTDHALFRIGEDFVARFPLQPGDVEAARRSLESEAAAASELLGRTRFPTPEPIALGEPGAGYPMPWSVQTWLPGTVATQSDPGESVAFAHDLAELISGVRAIDTRGRTFSGNGRGGDLPSHDEWMETCFEHSEGLLDVPRLRRMWAQLRALPRGDAEDVMNHGDLIPGNILVADGRLAGVLDVGGFGAADPSLDLVAAWHLLEAGPRQVLRDDLDCADLEWERGKAWAFQQSMGTVWYYVESNPPMSQMGHRTLHRLMADTSTPWRKSAHGHWAGRWQGPARPARLDVRTYGQTAASGPPDESLEKGRAVTTKSDFPQEEWSRIVRAPFVAGLAISLADPGGPIEAAKETMATLRSATNPPSREQFVTEVALDIQDQVQRKQNPLKGYRTSTEGEAPSGEQVLVELRAVQAIVAARATPEETAAFGRWLVATAQAAANAAKEGGFLGFGAEQVSKGEQQMLDQVHAAVTPA